MPFLPRRPLARLVLIASALFIALTLVCVARALGVRSRQPERVSVSQLELADPEILAGRLARALRLETVAPPPGGELDPVPFVELRQLLAELFPRVHTELDWELVGGHSLLFTWQGADPDLAPVLLLSHMDVVPVEDEGSWAHPPFGGQVQDGLIWGRGALDDKSGVLAILEAAEHLLASGSRPQRTHVFAFGHDEEVGGQAGAAALAARLRERGLRFSFALDEGGFYSQGLVEGVDAPLALIGVAEKGYLSLRLSARGVGGHSSAPGEHTAVGRVARAVARLEAQPMRARIPSSTRLLFETLAPELSFGRRLLFSNLWLFEPLVMSRMLASPASAAGLRTTTAATMIEGGHTENVLPRSAAAVVNFRLLPGDTPADVREHVRRAIDDPGVLVEVLGEPALASPQSSTNSEAWKLLSQTAHSLAPGALVAPYLLTGMTDSRHYRDLVEDTYRFLPVSLGARDLERLHGRDERVSIDDYARAVAFYATLIAGAGAP